MNTTTEKRTDILKLAYQMERAENILMLIMKAEQNHKRHIEKAQFFSGGWSDMYQYHIHRADISKRAANRLRIYFNHSLINITA